GNGKRVTGNGELETPASGTLSLPVSCFPLLFLYGSASLWFSVSRFLFPVSGFDQPRYPHSHQPHGPAHRETIQEGNGRLADCVSIVDWLRQGQGAGMGAEIAVADLQRHRPPAVSFVLEVAHDVCGQR